MHAETPVLGGRFWKVGVLEMVELVMVIAVITCARSVTQLTDALARRLENPPSGREAVPTETGPRTARCKEQWYQVMIEDADPVDSVSATGEVEVFCTEYRPRLLRFVRKTAYASDLAESRLDAEVVVQETFEPFECSVFLPQ